jgi:hypothetical protein
MESPELLLGDRAAGRTVLTLGSPMQLTVEEEAFMVERATLLGT